MSKETHCLQCGKRLTSRFQTKFCSQVCNGLYHHNKVEVIYNCICCGKQLINNQRKYCCNRCKIRGRANRYIIDPTKKIKEDIANMREVMATTNKPNIRRSCELSIRDFEVALKTLERVSDDLR